MSFIAKKGMKGGFGKAAVSVVSAAILAGGVGTVWSQVRSGTAFKPESSASLHGLRSNHVMLSEENATGNSPNTDLTDKDEKNSLNPDLDSDDINQIKKPDDQKEKLKEGSSLLDMSQNVLVTETPSDNGMDIAAQDVLINKNIQIYAAADNNSNEPAENTISSELLSDEKAIADKTYGRTEHSSGGSAGSGSVTGRDDGDNGSQSGNGGNTQSEIVKPDIDQTPSPSPTPDTEVTPAPTPDEKNNDTDEKVEDPDYPDGSAGPKLPEITDPLLAKPSYKKGTGSNTATEDIELTAVPAVFSDDGVVFYDGAVLTDWKILCASYVWVQMGNDRYRLTEYSDYFKIGEHPDIADGKLKVKFYFRQRTDIPWEEAVSTECEYDIKYAKILLMGEADASGNRSEVNTFYISDSDSPILAAEQIGNILATENSSSEIDYIIPGISFSPDGSDPIYDKTYLKKGGRYTIYPLDRIQIPEGMEVEHTYGWYDGNSPYIKRQMLVKFGSDKPAVADLTETELIIEPDADVTPVTDDEDESGQYYDEGTDEKTDKATDETADETTDDELDDDSDFDVELEYDAQSDYEIVSVPEGIFGISCEEKESSSDILKIPSSVHTIDMPARFVRRAYIVSEDNLNYSSADGVLYNKDQTEIFAVPWLKKKLVVSEDVEKINIEAGNSIKKLVLNCRKVPKIDLSALGKVEIVVPKELYQEYLVVWGNSLKDATLTTADGTVDETYTKDNGIYSLDGRILYGITKDARGLYQVPESVSTIKSGASAYCTLEEGIYISSDIGYLESDSLSGEGIKTIYFACDNPPEIEKDTFGDLDDAIENRNLQIIVSSDNRDDWIQKWGEVIGEDYARKLIVGTQVLSLAESNNGLSYIETDDGATLLKAPREIESFSELEDMEMSSSAESDIDPDSYSYGERYPVWRRIGSYAFEGCSSLKIVELPETVTEIGTKAFSNCKNLEMVLVKAKGTVDLGKNSFSDGATVAFNASVLNVEEIKTSSNILMYVPGNCDIYIESGDSDIWNAGNEYILTEGGKNGTLLYGLETVDDEKEAYLIKATSDIEGEILPPKGYPLSQVINCAFENCKEEFYITHEVSMEIEAIDDSAFEDSGLSGDLIISKACFLIGESAFKNCGALETITFEESAGSKKVKESCDLSVESGAFYGSGIKEVVFEDNLTYIDPDIFEGCNNLESVTFTGETPPKLICYYRYPYRFGWEEIEEDDDDDIWDDFDWFSDDYLVEDNTEKTSGSDPVIIIRNGNPEDYAEAWQYPMAGYGSLEDMEEDAELDALFEVFMSLSDDQIFDDNFDYRENISRYINDYKKARAEQLCYKGMLRACRVLGLAEPDDPQVILPVLSDYVDDLAEDVVPYELVDAEEIIDVVDLTDTEEVANTDELADAEKLADSDLPKLDDDFLVDEITDDATGSNASIDGGQTHGKETDTEDPDDSQSGNKKTDSDEKTDPEENQTDSDKKETDSDSDEKKTDSGSDEKKTDSDEKITDKDKKKTDFDSDEKKAASDEKTTNSDEKVTDSNEKMTDSDEMKTDSNENSTDSNEKKYDSDEKNTDSENKSDAEHSDRSQTDSQSKDDSKSDKEKSDSDNTDERTEEKLGGNA